jgi:hypothetical protein
MFMRIAAALLFLAAAIGSASAQDTPGCEKFKWSIARERAWFAANPKPVDAGAEVGAGEVGYVVALVAGDAAGFVAAPERARKPGTFGGVLKSVIGKAGLYQITLSDEAWVDVVQNGASVKSSGFSGQKACPGVRKSVRFDLAAGPATLQISNSETAKIMVAIAPAE